MLREGYLETKKQSFFELRTAEETPINNMISISRRGCFSSIEGFEVRDLYKEFFNNEGAVCWQPKF